MRLYEESIRVSGGPSGIARAVLAWSPKVAGHSTWACIYCVGTVYSIVFHYTVQCTVMCCPNLSDSAKCVILCMSWLRPLERFPGFAICGLTNINTNTLKRVSHEIFDSVFFINQCPLGP
jgi:hypothetical protein